MANHALGSSHVYLIILCNVSVEPLSSLPFANFVFCQPIPKISVLVKMCNSLKQQIAGGSGVGGSSGGLPPSGGIRRPPNASKGSSHGSGLVSCFYPLRSLLMVTGFNYCSRPQI